jgi:hypothetical protein
VVGQAQTGVAQGPQQGVRVVEKFLQAISQQLHGQDIFLARTLVAAQQEMIAAVALRFSLQQDPSKLLRILETQIDALAGQWMHIVRGIADQRHARFDQLIEIKQAQGKGGGRGDQTKLSKGVLARFLNAAAEFVRRQRHQLLRQGIEGRPDDGNAVAGQRQVGEDAVLPEPLVSAVAVRLFRCEIGHHAVLSIGAWTGFDAGLRTHPGIAPVGADNQLGAQRAAILQGQGGSFFSHVQRRAGRRAENLHIRLSLHCPPQAILHQAALGDEGQFFHPGLVGAEIQLCCCIIAPNVHFMHRRDAALVQAAPRPALIEEARIGGVDGIDAVVPAFILGKGRRGAALDQGDMQPAVFQRHGQRSAH